MEHGKVQWILTNTIVTTHAEAHPVPLVKSLAGLWRFNEKTGMAAPMLVIARVFRDEIEIREPRIDSTWQTYRSRDWPGTFTPVRPHGGDLPADSLRSLLSELTTELEAADRDDPGRGCRHVGTAPLLASAPQSVRVWLERLVERYGQ